MKQIYETYLWNKFMKQIYETNVWTKFMKQIYETLTNLTKKSMKQIYKQILWWLVTGERCEMVQIWSNEAKTLFLSELTSEHLIVLIKWTLLGSAFPFSFNSSQSFLKAFFSFNNSSTPEIIEIVKGLKIKSTSDMSILPLKKVSNILAPVLSCLVSTSLHQGKFPQKLKIAKVIPLHKGGSRAEVSNYRPISLLSCFSKIFEKIMQARLLDQFIKSEKILFDS